MQEENTPTLVKSVYELAQETEAIRKEIRYYIENFLPQIEYKVFQFKDEEGKFGAFAILREFRLMALLFNKQLKKYNLDARTKLIIFFGGKCQFCGKADKNLELHHRYKDGKNERAGFEAYGVYIFQYYLIHLEEAVARLKPLCPECHEEAHNGYGFGGSPFADWVGEILFR